MKTKPFAKPSLFVAILLSVLVMGAVQPKQAFACSCMAPGTPLEELAQSDAVFAGEVITIQSAGGLNREVTFQVANAWKGVAANEVKVRTGNDSAMCGFEFVQGETYLVYASLSEENTLQTGLCTRTALLSAATADRAALDNETEVTPDPVDADIPEPEPRTSSQGGIIFVGVLVALALIGIGYALMVRKNQV